MNISLDTPSKAFRSPRVSSPRVVHRVESPQGVSRVHETPRSPCRILGSGSPRTSPGRTSPATVQETSRSPGRTSGSPRSAMLESPERTSRALEPLLSARPAVPARVGAPPAVSAAVRQPRENGSSPVVVRRSLDGVSKPLDGVSKPAWCLPEASKLATTAVSPRVSQSPSSRGRSGAVVQNRMCAKDFVPLFGQKSALWPEKSQEEFVIARTQRDHQILDLQKRLAVAEAEASKAADGEVSKILTNATSQRPARSLSSSTRTATLVQIHENSKLLIAPPGNREKYLAPAQCDNHMPELQQQPTTSEANDSKFTSAHTTPMTPHPPVRILSAATTPMTPQPVVMESRSGTHLRIHEGQKSVSVQGVQTPPDQIYELQKRLAVAEATASKLLTASPIPRSQSQDSRSTSATVLQSQVDPKVSVVEGRPVHIGCATPPPSPFKQGQDEQYFLATLAQRDHQIHDLQKRLAAAEATASNAGNQGGQHCPEGYSAALAQRDHKIHALQERVAKLTNENEDLQERLASESATKEADEGGQHCPDEYSKTLAQLDQQILNFQGRLAVAEGEASKLAQRDLQILDLQKRLAAAEAEALEWKTLLQRSPAVSEIGSERLEAEPGSMAALQASRQQTLQAWRALEAHSRAIEVMRTELQNSKVEVQTLRSDLSTKTVELTRARAELQSLQELPALGMALHSELQTKMQSMQDLHLPSLGKALQPEPQMKTTECSRASTDFQSPQKKFSAPEPSTTPPSTRQLGARAFASGVLEPCTTEDCSGTPELTGWPMSKASCIGNETFADLVTNNSMQTSLQWPPHQTGVEKLQPKKVAMTVAVQSLSHKVQELEAELSDKSSKFDCADAGEMYAAASPKKAGIEVLQLDASKGPAPDPADSEFDDTVLSSLQTARAQWDALQQARKNWPSQGSPSGPSTSTPVDDSDLGQSSEGSEGSDAEEIENVFGLIPGFGPCQGKADASNEKQANCDVRMDAAKDHLETALQGIMKLRDEVGVAVSSAP